MGNWRGNSTMSYSTANGPENWGSVRLEGDDDLTADGAYVRNLGMGIEGRPVESSTLGVPGSSTTKASRRASAISWSSGKATMVGSIAVPGKTRQPSSSTAMGSSAPEPGEHYGIEEAEAESHRRTATTSAILQTFHAHTLFQLSVLEDLLSRQGISSSPEGGVETVVNVTPKDILAFELGPLSGLDTKYLEWLVQEYAGDNVKVVVKRSWKDLVVAVFGYG